MSEIAISKLRCGSLQCALLAALLIAVGCEQVEPTPSAKPSDRAQLHTVALHQRSSAGVSVHTPHYTLAVSIYVGWMPWYYADQSGVLQKWAEREGIEIEVVSMDYITSVEAFVAGRADACAVTNMEALGLPAAAGVDTTVLIVGDYSNGNDKILTRGIDSLEALRGVEISLVELSVSDYLLSRALSQAGMTQHDVKLLNTGDSKIGAEFLADKSRKAVVTWNPIAMELERESGIKCIYDSSQIPGEILDLCVVNSETLRRDPRLGRAMVGAWYEVLALMQQPDTGGAEALEEMARLAGCNADEYRAQLETTFMYWDPAAAVDYASSAELQRNMELVRQFCFAKNLLGEGARSVDDVGIAYPDGTVQGKPDRVRLRFDTSFVKAAE